MVVSIYWIMITSKLISFQILIVICRKYGSIILCVCIFFFFFFWMIQSLPGVVYYSPI